MSAPDRLRLNDELTALLQGFGWVSETDDEDDQLNELTHFVAGWIETRLSFRKNREPRHDGGMPTA